MESNLSLLAGSSPRPPKSSNIPEILRDLLLGMFAGVLRCIGAGRMSFNEFFDAGPRLKMLRVFRSNDSVSSFAHFEEVEITLGK